MLRQKCFDRKDFETHKKLKTKGKIEITQSQIDCKKLFCFSHRF